ncbi:Sodium:neurotransmitter symporter family protein [Dictyocaulus viviparus]|uniref:Sodium:neurotransmitter symporter family protein n=1 Tax=Dictyocaulus viviparus TaxID=29172 RepID=A0A0D8Y4N2_DICVI|nr:Sodium:neurotransmitter symporter family protein [Dictyocaulus viviparus]
MFLVGLPLVYLEMALGQFTTMNVVVIFERMAPIASGLGVSMLLLSLLVTVMDYSLLFTLFTVLGNSVQININEMPWHRCSNEGDSQTCDSMVKCHQQYERIFHESISQVGVAEHDYIYSDDTEGTHIERFRLRDALAIVIYIFAAISLYSTAHVLFRAIGGLYLFDGSVENYAAHLQEKRNERLYSQFFSYWTTAGDLIVYGPFEPFLQLVLSFGCALIVLISNVVTIESIVANCVAALDSSDDASKLTIRTILTFFLALCSFFLNSKVGLNTAITIENTVIPIATACVVLIELFVVGVIYGFSRLCANCLSMNSQKEGDRLLLRIWTLSYLYFWSLSPFLILASMIVAFPYPPPSMGIIATCIVIFIILPTPVIAVLVVVREKHNMGNLRFLLVPNHNLWGPRMADDRIKATRMEKEAIDVPYEALTDVHGMDDDAIRHSRASGCGGPQKTYEGSNNIDLVTINMMCIKEIDAGGLFITNTSIVLHSLREQASQQKGHSMKIYKPGKNEYNAKFLHQATIKLINHVPLTDGSFEMTRVSNTRRTEFPFNVTSYIAMY